MPNAEAALRTFEARSRCVQGRPGCMYESQSLVLTFIDYSPIMYTHATRALARPRAQERPGTEPRKKPKNDVTARPRRLYDTEV